jgi:hypothetical protein
VSRAGVADEMDGEAAAATGAEGVAEGVGNIMETGRRAMSSGATRTDSDFLGLVMVDEETAVVAAREEGASERVIVDALESEVTGAISATGP